MAIQNTEASTKDIEDYLSRLQQVQELKELGDTECGTTLRYSYCRDEVYLSDDNRDSIRFVDLNLGDVVDWQQSFKGITQLLSEVPSLTEVYGGRMNQLTPDEREELVLGIISPSLFDSRYLDDCRNYFQAQVMSLDPSGDLLREGLVCAIQTQVVWKREARILLDDQYKISPGKDAWLVDEIYRLSKSHGPEYVSELLADRDLIYEYRDDFYIELMKRLPSEPLPDKLVKRLIGRGWDLSGPQERARTSWLGKLLYRTTESRKWIYEKPFFKGGEFYGNSIFRHLIAFQNRITRIAKEQPEHRELVHRFIDWAVDYKA